MSEKSEKNGLSELSEKNGLSELSELSGNVEGMSEKNGKNGNVEGMREKVGLRIGEVGNSDLRANCAASPLESLDARNSQSEFTNKPSLSAKDLQSNSFNALVNIACGPFCLEGSLDWEPLDAFLQVCAKKTVQFVILCSPFLPESIAGALDGFPEVILREQIFEKRIFPFCQAFPNVQVLVVPSGQEVSSLISPSPLPQPAFKVNNQQHSNLHLCTNPSALNLFNAQGKSATLKLLNADILLGLSREEVTKASPKSPSPMLDRMSRLAGYLVEQQNLYPLVCPGLEVEYTQIWNNEAFVCCSEGVEKNEVLILPSSLRFFAKNVGGVTVVNPGQLCRSRAGGVYCQIEVGESVKVKIIKI